MPILIWKLLLCLSLRLSVRTLCVFSFAPSFYWIILDWGLKSGPTCWMVLKWHHTSAKRNSYDISVTSARRRQSINNKVFFCWLAWVGLGMCFVMFTICSSYWQNKWAWSFDGAIFFSEKADISMRLFIVRCGNIKSRLLSDYLLCEVHWSDAIAEHFCEKQFVTRRMSFRFSEAANKIGWTKC